MKRKLSPKPGRFDFPAYRALTPLPPAPPQPYFLFNSVSTSPLSIHTNTKNHLSITHHQLQESSLTHPSTHPA